MHGYAESICLSKMTEKNDRNAIVHNDNVRSSSATAYCMKSKRQYGLEDATHEDSFVVEEQNSCGEQDTATTFRQLTDSGKMNETEQRLPSRSGVEH